MITDNRSERTAEARVSELERDLNEARRLIYAPGLWKCARCNFRLVQANLNASDGTVTARDTPGDKCPNCSSPLWRVSWKDEANENLEIGEQQVRRAEAAEARVSELTAEVERLRDRLDELEATAVRAITRAEMEKGNG